jgi:hypothetical protein
MAKDDDFIEYIWPHAVAASEATGVDPRIIAGQAAVESGWGRHVVGNNLFGIKGPGVNALTTEVGANGPYQTQSSFRAYDTPADSVSGYADFINANPRYSAFQNSPDIRGQLTALQRSGYATDPQYAGKVAGAAAAIDTALRKQDAINWSGQPGTPADIKTALGYTGQPEPAKAEPVSDTSSDFFKDMGLTPKKADTSTTTPANGQGGDFFSDMGIKPPEAKTAPAGQKSGSAATPAIPTGDASAAAGQAVFDLPVVGPYVQGGLAKATAAARSVQYGTPYSQELANVQDFMERTKEAHPYATGGGRVLGAMAAAAPVGVTAVGGRLLGMTGNMIPRMLYGGASAGTLGAADAYTHGDNPLIGGVTGVVGGTGAPVLGGMIGAGVNALTNTAQKYLMPTGVSGVSRPAAQIASQVVGMEDPAAIRSTFSQLGPLGMLAEAGPSTTGLAGALALKPSEAKTVVTNAISARAAGRDARLATDVAAAVGPDPVPSHIQASIEASQGALSPEYNAALANARAVDTEPLANRLDSSVANLRGPAQRAVRDVRGMLNIPGTDNLDPHPGALLATRNAIDGLVANEQNPQVIRQLTMARRDVDAELARAVPGIKDVDAKFQELSRQSEALQAGGQALDSGKTAIRPQEFAQNFAQGANPAGTLVGPSAVPLRTQQGMAGEVHRLVGTKGNDLVALRNVLQGEGGWNTAKLTEAFGPENTNRLLGGVAREGAFDATTNELIRNSATARRQAAEELLKDSEPGSLNLLPASAAGVAMQAGKKVLFDPLVQLLTANPSAPRNLELARMMVAQGATRDQILQQLLRLNARQQSVSNTGNLLAGVLGGGSNRLISGAAVTNRP